jgi:hypothetical protein
MSRPPRFPLRYFKLGEEMFFPAATTQAVWKRACELKPMRFRVRQVQIRGVPGAYVWRIA